MNSLIGIIKQTGMLSIKTLPSSARGLVQRPLGLNPLSVYFRVFAVRHWMLRIY